MDLGLARSEGASGQSLTGVQTTMGTPGYIAPEQAMDAKTADKRSDIFGMGATLYALLTGRPPFKSEAVMKTLMAAMHMGVSTLRRRPLRTSLTAITIILLTFTILSFASFGQAQVLTQMVVNLLQQATALPESEVMIDGAPGRKVLGQVPPLAGGAHNVEHRIEQFPIGVLAWAARLGGFGKTIMDEVPFGVR